MVVAHSLQWRRGLLWRYTLDHPTLVNYSPGTLAADAAAPPVPSSCPRVVTFRTVRSGMLTLAIRFNPIHVSGWFAAWTTATNQG